jgi:hypothetical protein
MMQPETDETFVTEEDAESYEAFEILDEVIAPHIEFHVGADVACVQSKVGQEVMLR